MDRALDIFINYAGGSPAISEHVRRLDELLLRDGLRAWVADRDRQRDDDREHRGTTEALDRAPAFLACVGDRPIGSWGRKELERAAARALKETDYVICTVLLPGGSPSALESMPVPFRTAPTFDFRGGFTSVAPLMPMLWNRLLPERAELLRQIVAACHSGSRAIVIVGPPGSGKSSLARVAADSLRDIYPGGLAFVTFEPGRSNDRMADLVLRNFRLPREPDPIHGYRRQLELTPYLIVFDEADVDEVTELVPDTTSTTFFVARRSPHVDVEHKVFTMPPPRDPHWGAPPGPEHSNVQAGYTSDAPIGADLLDVQGPVNALCSVIAAKEVKPPLSIGLFGDWGTGKTFFIGQMRRRIELLADASIDADRSAYCSSIHQIVFNAWHYADANLWASLASRVFEGLAGEGGEAERLVERLESSRLQLAEADSDRGLAQQRVAAARSKEERTQRELHDTELELSNLADAAVDVLADTPETASLLNELRTVLRRGPDDEMNVEVARNLGTTSGTIRELWRQSKGLSRIVAAAAIVAVVVAIAAPDLLATIVAAVVAVASLIGLLAGPLRLVIRARTLARERGDALRRKRNVELQGRIHQLRLDERDANRRLEQAQRQVEETEMALAEIKSGQRLFSFIAERSRAEAYGSYLGVIATVRQDFERLAELIDGHDEGGQPRLERIVLYIDDLDRCPADRVVEVLEAVHLLMASELFVVVVAVDPHWLLRSLERRYSSEMAPRDDGEWTSTPQDYLEKIFQIPFALSRMEEDGFRRLIQSLIPVHEETSSPTAREPARAGSPVSGAGVPGPRNAPETGPQTPAPDPLDGADEIDLEPEALRVLPIELEFMSRLGGVVRTPRAAKRLANLYRLLRASLSPHQLDALLGRDGSAPGFYCVQLLLAIAVGSPSLAVALYSAVTKSATDEAWWGLVDAWTPPEGHLGAWQHLHDGMKPLCVEPLPPLSTFADWIPDVARFSYGATFTAG
jgi:KAP family P-loop domain